MRKLNLIVVDGCELTRLLLKCMFQASSAIEIVGEAGDYKSAVAVLNNVIPDGVIIGDELPESEEAMLVSAIQSDFSNMQVIKLAALENALQKAKGLPMEHLDHAVITAMARSSL